MIHDVRFDDDYIQVELTDGRVLSVPLWWVPSVHNARMEEREKYEVSRDRRMVIWDPDTCAINDEKRIDDYLTAGEAKQSCLFSKLAPKRCPLQF